MLLKKTITILLVTLILLAGCKKEDEENPNDFTKSSGTFTDQRDGNQYKWVKIGDQIWMAENLAFNIGEESWNYEHNNTYESKYGRLYTWEAAKKSCPTGWHLPSDAEWEQLAEFISLDNGGIAKNDGSWPFIGTLLKATNGWEDSGNGTDNYKFNALPSGSFSVFQNEFFGLGDRCLWWSSTTSEYYATEAWLRSIHSWEDLFMRDADTKGIAISVRCIKD